jgi:2',3'-cyclic-nucleotide 2'-phosphodiesterase (5'-nucleotidase family)
MTSRINNKTGHNLRSLLRLTAFMLVMAFVSPAFAATLAGWNVSGSTGWGTSPMAATVSDSNLTVGGLTRGSGVGITGTAAGRAWGGNNWLAANAVAAVTANQFATFSVTANVGKQVSFSSISKLDYRRSASGASTGVVQYQIGSSSFADITTVNYTATASTGGSISFIDLTAIPALQNVSPGTPVTFRIVNYGGTSASGTWYIFDVANTAANDFEIQGTVTDSALPTSSTLSTTIAGNGSGSISGLANPYAVGSTATITATPSGNSVFTAWSGCSTATTQTINVLMDSSKSCTANFTATSSSLTIFHVNDTHARLTPHKMIIPAHGTTAGQFEDVGGAAFLAGKMLQLAAGQPNALVIDAGDISEGNPIGDMGGNGSMTQFYTMLSAKLLAQRGRGMDAVVVGNHDVRDLTYVNNLTALKNSGVPVLSVNVRDKSTHLPYFAPYNIVAVNGKKVAILGYTIQTAEVGPTLTNTLEVVACPWVGSTDTTPCNISDYVNDLRNNQSVDIVVLAAHSGHSALVDPTAPVLADTTAAKLPEVVVTGHWHTIADTVWQPEMLNYKTIFTEANSYMKYIGELQVTDTGRYFSATNHIIRNADIIPDPDIQGLVTALTVQYNDTHPGHPVDEVIGYTGDNLLLDNDMKWWTADEYPWSGNNTAGQWICDAMRWKSEQLFGQTDLAIETGGGVRADIPAGPVTYLQIYETFPWNDDTFYRINMTGQEIVNFIKGTNLNTGFSSALDVTAYDGVPTSVKFNGAPIDLTHTYTVAINNYMYAHPPTGVTWSDTNPLTSPVLCREGIVDFMRSQHSTPESSYHVGTPRYHLNTEFSGGFRAVVTMMNDNEAKTTFEDAFIRFLDATPETLARRGSPQVPADLVNEDGTINPAHHLAEQELYRSFLGFKAGVLKPGDIIETWGKGSFYGGNPEFVDQEGIQADGAEFKIVGHDSSLAKPAFMSSIKDFWIDFYKNHYVEFLARKAGTDTVIDQNGQTIKLWDATGYTAKAIPGATGDVMLVSGVPTMENFALRFRCDSVTASSASLPAASVVSSHVGATPSGATSSPLTLTATASSTAGTYFLSPVADAQVASGNPATNYGAGTNLYVQSSTSGFGNERSWLKFDLSGIPASATITGANLQLWNFKATGPAMAAELLGGSDDSWTETGINWSNQPAFGASLATRTLDSAVTALWYQWDVSSFVQNKWSGNKLVSLLLKPAVEDSAVVPAPSYAFDAKEYGSNGPVLQINTQASGATVTKVDFYYRYSADNSAWGSWTTFVTATSAPFTASFNYPQGYGYYEFYSRATDSNSNIEPAPAVAQTATHYTAAPPYTTEALVTLGALTATYNGASIPASVTTVPPGLTVGTTYNGSSSVPVNAGTYTVLTTVTQAGYTGTASGTLTIGKATAAVSLGDLNFTYDGSPKGASITTTPAGVTVTITYDGSTTVPVNVGTYSVVATINDPNYQGTTSGTLVISDAGSGAAAVPGFGALGFMVAAAGLGGIMARRRKS